MEDRDVIIHSAVRVKSTIELIYREDDVDGGEKDGVSVYGEVD